MRWARLSKRVFDLDTDLCPRCGGKLKIIAAIEEIALIERMLTHLGLCARPRRHGHRRGGWDSFRRFDWPFRTGFGKSRGVDSPRARDRLRIEGNWDAAKSNIPGKTAGLA